MTHESEIVGRLGTHKDNPNTFGYLSFQRTKIDVAFAPRQDITIGKGDDCFVLHISSVLWDNGIPVMREISSELGMIARRIARKKDLFKTHVMGFTNAKIARVARRYGFATFEVDAPGDYKERVNRSYKMGIEGPVMMVYLSGSDFADRFRQLPRARGRH